MQIIEFWQANSSTGNTPIPWQFSDPSMINVNLDVTVIGNDGNPEEGTGVGVMREVLTSFWQLVYHSLTVGTQEKVLHG